MHRVDAPGHVANQFSNGNPGAGQMPTQLDKDWHNAVQEELCYLIEQAGIALVKGTNTQLRAAVLAMISSGALTAAQILARLITVDGSGSGLDSDLLDGQDGAYYANIAARLGYTPVNRAGDTMTGILNLLASSKFLAENAAIGEGGQLVLEKSSVGSLAGNVAIDINGNLLRIFELGGSSRGAYIDITQGLSGAGALLWHSGNDGAGSGLDAGLFAGQPPSYYGNPVGTVIQGLWATPPAGYLKVDGGSIGNAGSGATERANADCAALFAVLWALDPTVAIIQTSGGGASARGASAAADFAANQRIVIPDYRAGFARAWDDGRGIDGGRLLGSWQEDDFESHTHPGGTNSGALAAGAGSGPYASTFIVNTGAAGGTETRPKNFALMHCVKY